MMSMQTTMFGVSPERKDSFNVYHDESGTYHEGGGDRWLFHGVLFVPVSRLAVIQKHLLEIREKTGYFEELHYVKLSKSVKGPKAQCAKYWLEDYFNVFSSTCYFCCLCVDTESPKFDRSKFSEPHYIYNYFAKISTVGGIAWSLKPYDEVSLQFYSDNKSLSLGDNFARYLPQAVMESILLKRIKKPNSYPKIVLASNTLKLIDSNPVSEDESYSAHTELIQLTDLLTSGIAQAVTVSSNRRAKRNLANYLANMVEDTQRPPWLQNQKLHRRFSVSFFPDFSNPNINENLKSQYRLPFV